MSVIAKFKAAGAFALAAFLVPAVAAQPGAFDTSVLDGEWDFVLEPGEEGPPPCTQNRMRIFMSENGGRYNAIWPGDRFWMTSRITPGLPERFDGQDGFLIQYEQEYRYDEAGRPVSWYLVMTSRDSFDWWRLDRIGDDDQRRAAMVRCVDWVS